MTKIFKRDQTLREQKKAIEDDPSYWEWLDQLEQERQNEQHQAQEDAHIGQQEPDL